MKHDISETRRLNERAEFLEQMRNSSSFRSAYYYILGQYLGDGCISNHPKTYKLRIYAANTHPNIIEEIKMNLKIVFPNNKVGSFKKNGCVELFVYSIRIPMMYPHLGKGRKHERVIELSEFQLTWISEHSIDLIRGLFHSDGCYYKQRTLKDGTVVMNYAFSNKSHEIHAIYQNALKVNGIEYSFHRKTKDDETMMITGVYQRKAVDLAFSLIGSKS